ncbi:uncharacterized oxidoreductase C663.06c-like [Python bivittatus]|uniref:Uncharacterized oxidoreductase C663.06c-like n=1 Tax=Python bivittatus TaxID=176946 RepID=A0A9F5II21_PYTBI|nr:uncharacterized oxidoreductase C663.06c-like [Python bivittatus]
MAKAADFSVFSVLVTGSDRGIGLGLVKRFLMLPSPPKWVFATTLDLNGEETKEVKELACEHPNLVLLQLDVTVLESIKAAVKEVEKCVGEAGLTLLINNAGTWFFKNLENENAKDMMALYSVNTIGPLQMSQAFLPLLKKAAQRSPREGLSSSKAAIINISSALGSMEVMLIWEKGQAVSYRCSKAALNMVTKCQSLEYSADGILSISIHPGLEVKELACEHPNLVLLQLENENAKDMMAVYSVNTIGPLQMSQAFLPLLKKAAQRSPREGLSCSKAAIINISNALGSMEVMLFWEKVQTVSYRCSKPEITVEESTQGMMTVLSMLSEEDNGTFVDWLGRRIPW